MRTTVLQLTARATVCPRDEHDLRDTYWRAFLTQWRDPGVKSPLTSLTATFDNASRKEVERTFRTFDQALFSRPEVARKIIRSTLPSDGKVALIYTLSDLYLDANAAATNTVRTTYNRPSEPLGDNALAITNLFFFEYVLRIVGIDPYAFTASPPEMLAGIRNTEVFLRFRETYFQTLQTCLSSPLFSASLIGDVFARARGQQVSLTPSLGSVVSSATTLLRAVLNRLRLFYRGAGTKPENNYTSRDPHLIVEKLAQAAEKPLAALLSLPGLTTMATSRAPKQLDPWFHVTSEGVPMMHDLSEQQGRIFVSHGRNELVLLKLKTFLVDRLDLQPLILKEQPDEGMTIVEKLEKYGRKCVFALVLWTAEDATLSGDLRGRQNVIHEIGFFQGKYGRKRVLLLKQRGVEEFTNVSGILFKEFDDDQVESTFEGIRQELETAEVL